MFVLQYYALKLKIQGINFLFLPTKGLYSTHLQVKIYNTLWEIKLFIWIPGTLVGTH